MKAFIKRRSSLLYTNKETKAKTNLSEMLISSFDFTNSKQNLEQFKKLVEPWDWDQSFLRGIVMVFCGTVLRFDTKYNLMHECCRAGLCLCFLALLFKTEITLNRDAFFFFFSFSSYTTELCSVFHTLFVLFTQITMLSTSITAKSETHARTVRQLKIWKT